MESSQVMGQERGLRLLLQTLSSGSHGTLAALKAMQNIPGPFPWRSMTEMLCREIPTLHGPAATLTMKPALFCLPKQSQRNFYSFLNLVTHLLPSSCLRLLSNTVLMNEDYSDAWLNSLARRLTQDPQVQFSKPKVMENLQIVCEGLSQYVKEYSKLGWCNKPAIFIQRKRKVSCIEDTFLDKDFGYNAKRTCSEDLCVALPKNSISQENQNITEDHNLESQERSGDVTAPFTRLKEILHGSLDREAFDDLVKEDLKDICESCSPEQLQNVFYGLRISQISPQSLFDLCNLLQSFTPDFSYAHSSALAKSIFLEQVLSLTAPAPRLLLAALSIFCTKYAQSACSTLIEPLVLRAATGSVHIDFLRRMLFECLPPEHLPRCTRIVLEVPFCEGTINVMVMLFERKMVMSPSDFELLLSSLCQAPEMFFKSVAFSKLLLTIMSLNQTMILPSNVRLFTKLVNANQTFLKKSLQVILNKIQEQLHEDCL